MSLDISAMTAGARSSRKRKSLLTRVYAARYLYLLLLLPVVYFILFKYVPMYGIIIAFKNYNVSLGILGSPWAGMKYFNRFFSDDKFWQVLINALRIGGTTYLFSGWPSLLLALMLNEVRREGLRKSILMLTNLPHYISTVVVCGMFINLMSPSSGLINILIRALGGEAIHFIVTPQFFIPIYIISGIWQSVGFSSIIYLSALAGIPAELYEASCIEGASRFQNIVYITIPHLIPTFTIIMIMALGGIVGPSFEKILLLSTPSTYSVSDVVSTYVYRRGLLGADFSYATAIDVFNSLISLFFVLAANTIARRVGETSLF